MLNLDQDSSLRSQLAGELLALLPQLKKTFQAGIPQELRDELTHVTPHQLEALGVLMQLRGRSGGASMQEVARMQGCALSTATALADRLIGHGLAERIADAEDRRVVKIVPTERAHDLMEKFIASRRQVALAALRPLDRDEAAELIRLLRKMAWTDSDNEEVAHG